MDFTKSIKEYYDKEKKALEAMNIEEINDAMNCILDHYDKESTIFVMGNGGSSATASHMVCDFMKGSCYDLDKKMKMVCLNDNIPTLVALGNDVGFDKVFSYPLKSLAKPGDLVIAISGSGNSKNIIAACEVAKEKGLEIIGFTGYDGGKLHQMADYHVHLPMNDMRVAEDAHMIVMHLMGEIFLKHLGGTSGNC